MEIKVDLENIEEPEALPEGVYVVQVKRCEMKDSKRTAGNKNLEMDYVIIEGDHAGKEIRFDVLSLAQKALFRVRDFVEACGVFPGKDGFKTEELIGAILQVAVRLEPSMRNEIDINTGATKLVPRLNRDGKQVLRSRVSGYSAR